MATDSQTPRRALVTGASSGIGLAIVRALLNAGFEVTGISRRTPGDALDSDLTLNSVAADLAAHIGYQRCISG